MAAERLREALALFHGAPLADVLDGAGAHGTELSPDEAVALALAV